MNESEAVQQVHGNILIKVWSRTFIRAILFGILSASAYLLVFLNQDTVTEYFTKGGAYTLVVIATAIVFSLLHGTFANYVLELVGIRAQEGH